VDDFVAFGNSKEKLHEIKNAMEEYLEGLRLRLHERKCRIFRVDEGVGFLGYRVFPTHRLIKKENALRMRRRLRKLSAEYREGEIPLSHVRQSIQSWIGHDLHADTFRLRGRIMGCKI
jgi:hypothetical protein